MQLKIKTVKQLILSLGFILLLGVSAPRAETLPPKRIISLAPNVTEILYELGLKEQLVGVTDFCDFPEEAKDKQKIGGMSNPSLEAIATLTPEVVIMTTDGNPKEIKARLESLGIKTFVMRARTLDELPSEIRRLGKRLNVPKEAETLALTLEGSIASFKEASKDNKAEKALFVIWPEPLIVAGPGTLASDSMALLNLKNIAKDAQTEYPKFSLEEILIRSPEIIFIGGQMGKGDMRAASSKLLKRLASTEAVKNGRVYFTGDSLMRLGPRVAYGIDELQSFINKKNKEN